MGRGERGGKGAGYGDQGRMKGGDAKEKGEGKREGK